MEVIAGVDRDADEGGPYSVGEGLADDILASLDAAGFQIVPLELPEEPGPMYSRGEYSRFNYLGAMADAAWRAEKSK